MGWSVVKGRGGGILFSLSISDPSGSEVFEEPTFILLKRVNKDKFSDVAFDLETDNDGIILDFKC